MGEKNSKNLKNSNASWGREPINKLEAEATNQSLARHDEKKHKKNPPALGLGWVIILAVTLIFWQDRRASQRSPSEHCARLPLSLSRLRVRIRWSAECFFHLSFSPFLSSTLLSILQMFGMKEKPITRTKESSKSSLRPFFPGGLQFNFFVSKFTPCKRIWNLLSNFCC